MKSIIDEIASNTSLGGSSINLVEKFRTALTASTNGENKEDKVSLLLFLSYSESN